MTVLSGFSIGTVLSMHTRSTLERFGAESMIPAAMALALVKETGPRVCWVFRSVVRCRRWRRGLITIRSKLTAYGQKRRCARCCASTRRNFLPEGMAGTGIGSLAAWTPSKNMNINAISITTTVMIDRMETYRKNAAVLPRSRSPEKAKIERCMSLVKAGGMPLSG